MKRALFLLYGFACYALFLGVFLYTIGFVGGFLTPTRLDASFRYPDTTTFLFAIFIDLLLVLLFAVQHSAMARPGFKAWLTRWVPQPIERSTYVLATNFVLIVLFWQWRPLGGIIWDVQSNAGKIVLWLLFAQGWLTVLITTCLINHFDLFGLRQVWMHFCGVPYQPLPFVTPGPYRLVRHPLYVGWLMAIWATPTMTVAHLLFALAMTAYILVAIHLEEKDLLRFHQTYVDYRRMVPMLIPRWSRFRSRTTD
ncbi:MAG: isoprenylcysteine carboxylmethyltransferase family protein [Planctomycetaceae bacterium]